MKDYVLFMQRKIIKLGTSTLVTSLPSKWILANNLKQGDSLTVVEEGPQVILSTKKEVRAKTAKLHIATPKDFMGRLIHTPYRFGYDRLEVSFDDPAVMPLIRRFLDETLGFEIVDQSEKSCVIEMVAKGLDEEFDKLLRRTFHLISGMLDDLASAVEKKEEDQKNILSDIIEREKMTDKLTYFCMRVLNTRMHQPGHTQYHMVLVWALEQIGDDIRDLAAHLLQESPSEGKLGRNLKGKEIVKISPHTFHLMEQAFKAFTQVYTKPTHEGLLKARNLTRQCRKNAVVDPHLWAPIWSLLSTLDHLLLVLP